MWIWWLDHLLDKERVGWSQRAVVNGLIPRWRSVTSSIPRGHYWVLELFNIFVSGTDCTLRKFANDTKLSVAVNMLEEGMLSKGTWMGLEGGPLWTLKFKKAKCTLAEASPSTNTSRAENVLRAVEGLRGAGWWEVQNELPKCDCSSKSQPCPLMHQEQGGTKSSEVTVSLYFLYLLWGHTCSTASSSWASNTRRTGFLLHHCNAQYKGTLLKMRVRQHYHDTGNDVAQPIILFTQSTKNHQTNKEHS